MAPTCRSAGLIAFRFVAPFESLPMQRIWQFFLDPRVLAVIGIAALAGLLLLGADALRVGMVWAAVVLALLLLGWVTVWGGRQGRQGCGQVGQAR
jgi:hypothetical protein